MQGIFMQVLVIAILLVGFDFLMRVPGPRVHRIYRRGVSSVLRYIRRQIVGFSRWAWLNYRQFIIGVGVGILAALYFTGHFQ